MRKVGIVGWRGMVGSTLTQRMEEENDFNEFKGYFFSTSQAGEKAPSYPNVYETLLDANNFDELVEMDIILSCQGSDYTQLVHQKLRSIDWSGIWIDAASQLRMDEKAIIVLDPINAEQIKAGLNRGIKDFVGGNCTTSLMLMAIGGLFKEDLVEWMNCTTYQAASGAGANAMIELLSQMSFLSKEFNKQNPIDLGALELEKLMQEKIQEHDFPKSQFTQALALSALPWIDVEGAPGKSKEEWKCFAETNKIIGGERKIPIDSTCVRISSLRSHSQSLMLKLKKDVPLNRIEEIITNSNQWVDLIPNNKESTLAKLTPVASSGKLSIPIGRLRKLEMGGEYLGAYTCGDQLLWGAAEPLRRMLRVVLG